MIERAIILKIQKEQPNVQLFIKLILQQLERANKETSKRKSDKEKRGKNCFEKGKKRKIRA